MRTILLNDETHYIYLCIHILSFKGQRLIMVSWLIHYEIRNQERLVMLCIECPIKGFSFFLFLICEDAIYKNKKKFNEEGLFDTSKPCYTPLSSKVCISPIWWSFCNRLNIQWFFCNRLKLQDGMSAISWCMLRRINMGEMQIHWLKK